MTRCLAALALLAASASAQFYGLATPSDGSAVYFTTALRIRGTAQPIHGKVFVADEAGVRLVESRDRVDVPGQGLSCVLGGLYNFSSVDLSADGKTLAAAGYRAYNGLCRGLATAGTMVRSAASTTDYPGWLRLSANGRWAVGDDTIGVFTPPSFSLIDLSTGQQKTLRPNLNSFLTAVGTAGRTVTDDGSILFTSDRLYLLHPDGALDSLPETAREAYAITPDGRRLLYAGDGLRVRDLRSGDDVPIVPDAYSVRTFGFSDDGSRVAFLRDGQAFVADLGRPARGVGNVADIESAVMSGDGRTLYAATWSGRLVKIVAETGTTIELVGRTPDITNSGLSVDGGMFFQITGRGFAEASATADAPLPESLGGVAVTIGGRKVPIARVTPTTIDVLVPPGEAADSSVPVVVASEGTRTPFDSPQSQLRIFNGPRAGAIAHQNWDSLVTPDNGPHVGEIIHVWAVGLGPVSPDPPLGAVAPSSEPYPRLAQPMACSNAEVLYAGLAPGFIARIYQIDMRIGPQPGYQQIPCTIGSLPATFLTFNVLP